MGILLIVKCCYSDFSEDGCFHSALWLVTNLHQSAEERNFVSDNQHISGKNFRCEFSCLQLMVVCDHIYLLVSYYYFVIFITSDNVV